MPEHAISGAAVAAGPLNDRSQRSGAAGALSIAGLCLLALAAVWAVAQLVPAAHLRDAVALRDFTLLSHPRVDSLASFLVHLLEPALFILWAVA
ncbi:MAG TPA: hypothetical protein VNY34_01085, partial [Solirubrobacteraceae bacterium]|nr:hypothetical protein [Solirubrobacteraceae bacterium]